MVNAYFSSNRAFVSGSPIVVPRSEYTPRDDFAPTGRSSSSSSFVTSAMNNGTTPSTSTSTFSVGGKVRQSNVSNRRRSSSSLPSLRRGMFVQ